MPESNCKFLLAPYIVLVTGGMDCGGAQRVMADIANYWADKGWHVTLATWSGPELLDFYWLSPKISRIWLNVNTPVSSFSSAVRVFVARIFRLRTLLRRVRADTVLSFIDVSNIHTILASRGLDVRVVISERTHPGLNFTVPLPWRILRRVFYCCADQVVAQTQDAARWLERHCRTDVLVIPNAVRPMPTPPLQREQLVIGVGRLSAEKGFDLLLEAFARVGSCFPEWRLCIIGQGPQRQFLTTLAAKLNLRDRVEFIGEVRNVEAWMARAALMVHPSRREGFPNAVLEAMAMAVTVICADCHSGAAELIQDGINGRLVPVDDLGALARVMSDCMASSDLRKQLGVEAAKVRQRYEQSVVMGKWEATVLAQPSRKSCKAASDMHSG